MVAFMVNAHIIFVNGNLAGYGLFELRDFLRLGIAMLLTSATVPAVIIDCAKDFPNPDAWLTAPFSVSVFFATVFYASELVGHIVFVLVAILWRPYGIWIVCIVTVPIIAYMKRSYCEHCCRVRACISSVYNCGKIDDSDLGTTGYMSMQLCELTVYLRLTCWTVLWAEVVYALRDPTNAHLKYAFQEWPVNLVVATSALSFFFHIYLAARTTQTIHFVVFLLHGCPTFIYIVLVGGLVGL